jgi:hypothetical protein
MQTIAFGDDPVIAESVQHRASPPDAITTDAKMKA